MDSNFFALISRMRYIARWGLMRNALPENIQEHSHMVAVLAHALGVIRRDIFRKPCDVNALATAALYHDASEILTGDLPTPIKYHNAEIMSAYRAVEDLAVQKLLGMLPPELRATYAAVLDEDKDGDIYPLVKAADKLSAYIKCIEERKAGNNEFLSAEAQTRAALEASPLPEVHYFLEHFIPAFERNRDRKRPCRHHRRRDRPAGAVRRERAGHQPDGAAGVFHDDHARGRVAVHRAVCRPRPHARRGRHAARSADPRPAGGHLQCHAPHLRGHSHDQPQ